MPGGGEDIVLRHMVIADSPTAASVAEFLSGWLAAIGIGIEPRHSTRASSSR